MSLNIVSEGVNCQLGDMCEDEETLCAVDMLSTHVWLHVTSFLLSQDLGHVFDAVLAFFLLTQYLFCLCAVFKAPYNCFDGDSIFIGLPDTFPRAKGQERQTAECLKRQWELKALSPSQLIT